MYLLSVWGAGGQGGLASCFHVGDSFVEVRGGLIEVQNRQAERSREGRPRGPG